MSERSLDFTPLEPTAAVERSARPSLSYWQDAWIRLKANRRAIISLWIVVALLIFTLVGPLIWSVDPSDTDLDQISRAPFANRDATIVADYESWSIPARTTSSGAPFPANLRLADVPTTQAVRLLWDRPDDAVGYRVYRNTLAPGAEAILGLPLADILSASTVGFEDRLDLRARTYFYSVVGLDANGYELPGFETITADVSHVITAEEAVQKGLIPQTTDVVPGNVVQLALHPLGTDYLGRDLLARLMHGARVSLFIGIVAPFVYVALGIVYGSIAGFLGGRIDQLLMRFADFVVALPFLLFMILFRILFKVESGDSGIVPMLIAMVVLSWPATARLVRGQILTIREAGYIGASRLLGARTGYLVMRHMIPNTMGVILVTLTFAVPSAIFTEAFLSFIGMGVAPPTPSWGSMCNEGLKTMLTTPHELLAPAILISITVLAFNLLGDGLRDALDARMRSTD